MKKQFLLILLLTACEPTLNTIYEPVKIQTYFCQVDNCTIIFEEFRDGNCALYNTDLNFSHAVIHDRKNGLMHNKFCVIGNKTITGSTNPTKTNIKEANNLLLIESKTIAENYLAEYNELKQETFGTGEQVKNPVVNYANGSIASYFCPEDNCKQKVLAELNNAKQSIHFLLNTFTDEEIGNLLVEKAGTITVTGCLDTRQNQYSQKNKITAFTTMKKLIHHKVFIIDEETVIAGSYNPTKSANERNDENIVIIKDKQVAQEFMNEYNRAC